MDVGRETSRTAGLIWLIATPIVFVVGIVGNGITIAVFLSPKNKTSSTTIYLIWLACADSMMLLIDLPRWWAIYSYHGDIRHYSDMTCKVHLLGIVYSTTVSSYVLLALTIERLICTVKPHRVKLMCTPKTANMVCVAIIGTTVLLTAGMWYGYGLTRLEGPEVNKTLTDNMAMYDKLEDSDFTNNNITFNDSVSTVFPEENTSYNNPTLPTSSPNCVSSRTTLHNAPFPHRNNPACTEDGWSENRVNSGRAVCSWYRRKKYVNIIKEIDQIIHFVIVFLFTELVFIVVDIIIIYKLISSKKPRLQMTNSIHSGSSIRRNSGQVRQVTLTLISVNIVFILCRTPVYVFLSFTNRFDQTDDSETTEIIWAIINVFFFTNHAVNFILYVLIGRKFRGQVVDMLCGGWRRTGRQDSRSKNVVVGGRTTVAVSSPVSKYYGERVLQYQKDKPIM